MAYVVSGYEPAALFNFFEDISAIPRPSGKEERVASYLVEFANQRGLSCHRDSSHNVIIKKSGTAGKENNPAIIFQGHTDMVCEKNSDVDFDFLTKGLSLVEEDGFLKATGTTLGADNGIAVALMLTLLDDKTLSHPPLECVFTVQEETGLTGASKLDVTKLSGKTMINLDSEQEDIATVSCAGGMRIRLFKDAQWEPVSGKGIRIKIQGLTGGHSGVDIEKDRANANKLMGRVLGYLAEDRVYFRICEVNGGNKDNAIPRECDCTIFLNDPSYYEQAVQILTAIAKELKAEIASTDPAFTVTISPASPTRAMSSNATIALSSVLFLAPNGVRYRNYNEGNFVVSSINMGVVKTADNGVTFTFSPRSSVESLQRLNRSELALIAGRYGFAMQVDSYYPGWRYSSESKIRDIFCSCYKEQTGKELKLEAIHAGLECGLFVQKLPDLDVIAVGPNIHDCHTPVERLDLSSCERFYSLICRVLDKM